MEQDLQRLVGEVARRVRRRRAEFYGLRGCFYGAVLALIPLLLKGLLGLAAPLVALGVLAIGATSGALFGWFRQIPLPEAARLADRTFGLKDRVATALEWIPRADRTPLVTALVEDARARIQGLDPSRVVPRRFPSEGKFLPLPLVLSAALLLLPPIPLPAQGLPSFFSSTAEPDAREERAGALATDERPKGVKKAPLDRVELMERDLIARQGSQGSHQPGDLSAIFKDTSLGTQRPDFSSFLRQGDERLRMLEQVDRLPDLKRDFTQSQYKMVFQRAKSLFGGLRPDQLSPQKLRDLLEEMERLGRKGGDWGGDVGEGLEGLEQGQTDRALEAMEKALAKMRGLEERDRSGRSLRGGRESDRQRSRGRSAGDEGSPEDYDMGEGSLPGKGKNPNPRGDATARLRASPYDTGVEGETRSGRKAGFDTNFLGRGVNLPSRLQYLSVYSQYRKMMEEALAQEQVPRDYQRQVKEYFQSLEER